MKQTEMITLGLAAVAVYLIVSTNKKTATGTTSGASLRNPADFVSEIFDTAGKAFSNGWRYFNDGTAIDPAGNYYQGGQLIWQNTTSPRWSV